MSEQWQIRRGTTAENDDFTGAQGELTMDTQTKGLRVHDGTTQGGIEVPTAGTADYVVDFQIPTAENNYVWYRKYKSGWVEQGGRASGDVTVYLPVIMSNANYTLVITKNDGDSGTQAYGTSSITSSSFYANRYTSGLGLFSWQVSGMAA